MDAWDEEVRRRYPHLPAALEFAWRRSKPGSTATIPASAMPISMSACCWLLSKSWASLRMTVIIVTSDHGENQGELNVWGDHQTADHITCRVPLIIRWPGLTSASGYGPALQFRLGRGADRRCWAGKCPLTGTASLSPWLHFGSTHGCPPIPCSLFPEWYRSTLPGAQPGSLGLPAQRAFHSATGETTCACAPITMGTSSSSR